MGRELVFKLRRIENSESSIECEDYVCGRDDCTNYIAQQILDDGDDYSLVYKLDDKQDCLKLSNFLGMISGYAAEDSHEILKAQNALEDLREARRHCSLYEEFVKFSDAIDNTEQWLHEESYSRANNIYNILTTFRQKAEDEFGSNVKYEIIIDLSE